jgi:hypothetical protein
MSCMSLRSSKRLCLQVLTRIADAKAAKKRKRDGGSEKDPKRKSDSKAKSAACEHAAGGVPERQRDVAVEKMKRVCQQAGIKISPHVYKQPDRRAAFLTLLSKHGLSASSGVAPPLRVTKPGVAFSLREQACAVPWPARHTQFGIRCQLTTRKFSNVHSHSFLAVDSLLLSVAAPKRWLPSEAQCLFVTCDHGCFGS